MIYFSFYIVNLVHIRIILSYITSFKFASEKKQNRQTDRQRDRQTTDMHINILWYPNMHEFALSENTGLFLSKKGNKWKSMWAITWSMWTKCSCVSSIISHCIWSQNICLTKLHNGSCSLQKNFCNFGVQRITSTI